MFRRRNAWTLLMTPAFAAVVMIQMILNRGLLLLKSPARHRHVVQAFRPSQFVSTRSRTRTDSILSPTNFASVSLSARPKNTAQRLRWRSLTTLAAESDSDTPVINGVSQRYHVDDVDDDECPILKDLNPSQVKAVTQPSCSITRVVAGPGSGKTRVLTSRIAWLLQQDDRQRILGVTFTRKAAGEMQQRVQRLLQEQQNRQQPANTPQRIGDTDDVVIEEAVGDINAYYPSGLDRVTLGTFHSICAKILRWNGDTLAHLPSVIDDMSKNGNSNPIVLDSSFNIADQTEQLRILKEVLGEYNIDLKQHDLKPIQVLNAIGRCKAMLVQGENPFPEDGNRKKKKSSPAMTIAAKVYYACREKLLSSNCVDFDDLIYLTRELLLVNQETRDRLQRRWSHVLVDEFQDTSQTQMDLVKLLTSSSLFVVGDADQSIYSWRGAHAGSLSDFEHEYKGFNVQGVSTVYLMENYRSTSNIVKAAQKVISSSKKSTGADKLRQKMIPKRSAGPSPRIVACKDAKAEAEFVIKKIKDSVKSGTYEPNHSVALVYRTNAQSRALEEACVLYNLPYVIFGSATSFYKRQEIKDCLCYLRWLYNGRDRSSMLRAMGTPKRGIGDTAIREFDEYCSLVNHLWEETFPERLKPTPLEVLFHLSDDDSWCSWEDAQFPPPSVALSTRSLKVLTAFSKQMASIRNKAKVAPVEQVLSAIVNDMDFIPHLDKISKSATEFEERKANVQELQQASRRYTVDGACLPETDTEVDESGFAQSPLGSFLDDVALVTDMADNAKRSQEERLVVSLMTIHASKGMEFDTVFFVGIEDGTVPSSQSLQDGKGSISYEEEKRLCYVAMTRAKTELVMTWRHEVPIFTAEGIRTVRKRRSRFLDVLVSKNGAPAREKVQFNPDRAANKQNPANSLVPGKTTPRSAPSSKVAMVRSGSRKFTSDTPAYNAAKDTPRAPNGKKKLTGAASVYAKRKRSPLDEWNLQPSDRTSGSRPVIAEGSKRLSNNPRYRIDQQKRGQQTREKSTVRTTVRGQKIEPSWFFPVGSKVFNQQLGEGVVLPSAIEKDSGDPRVLVQFENGEQREFPVQSDLISPVVL